MKLQEYTQKQKNKRGLELRLHKQQAYYLYLYNLKMKYWYTWKGEWLGYNWKSYYKITDWNYTLITRDQALDLLFN